jgi:hypothetical protein
MVSPVRRVGCYSNPAPFAVAGYLLSCPKKKRGIPTNPFSVVGSHITLMLNNKASIVMVVVM